MKLSNEIVLRPRFRLEVEKSREEVLQSFLDAKQNQRRFGITCIDSHIFIRLPKKEQMFWSPQLHLEIMDAIETKSTIHGFFGPNPTVWTMFIFFHVVIAMLFIADIVWLYSNHSLGTSYDLQIGIGIAMVIIWILLYIGGSIGKRKGKPGMRVLYDFMSDTLN